MFITFEGLDFSGKSTQIQLLKDYLEQQNQKVLIIREPGGTQISEKIRNLLLDKKNLEMDIKSELLLFAASRAQLVSEVIAPKLLDGYFVLSDRFHDSSIAYQGYGRGINLDFVTNLQKFVMAGTKPKLTFFIDLPLDKIEERKRKIDQGKLDRMEILDRNFFTNVRRGYLELADTNERFKIIDGTLSIEKIHELICDFVVKAQKKD